MTNPMVFSDQDQARIITGLTMLKSTLEGEAQWLGSFGHADKVPEKRQEIAEVERLIATVKSA